MHFIFVIFYLKKIKRHYLTELNAFIHTKFYTLQLHCVTCKLSTFSKRKNLLEIANLLQHIVFVPIIFYLKLNICNQRYRTIYPDLLRKAELYFFLRTGPFNRFAPDHFTLRNFSYTTPAREPWRDISFENGGARQCEKCEI